MLPGPASQRGAGRAGREETALEPPRPSTPFSCFLVHSGRRRRRRARLRERDPELMVQATRASRSPEPRAAAFVRGRDATKRGGRLPRVAATARAPCSPPCALRRRLAGRLGPNWEASPWSERPAWTWHSPRSPRQPSLTEGIFFFLSPFPLPAIFRRGLPGGRAAREGARGLPRVAPAPLCRRPVRRIVAGQARLGLHTAGALQVGQRRRGLGGGGCLCRVMALETTLRARELLDYCSQARRKPSSHFEISLNGVLNPGEVESD